MKIAISTDGPDLSAPVNPRFGRCARFLIVDSQSGEFHALDNPGHVASGGAGIAAAEALVNQGIQAVLTGHVGPNAFEVLSAGGVSIYGGQTGSAQAALDAFRQNALTPEAAPTAKAHAGTMPAVAEPAAPETGSRRIAVAAEQRGLDAPCAAHFGRAPYFVLVDLRGDQVEDIHSVVNPYADSHQPGQVPTFVREQHAQVMLSGGMGARAVALFAEAGIDVATGTQGTVRQAIAAYLDGTLSGTQPCTDHAHGCH